MTPWILGFSSLAAWVITWITIINIARSRADKDARIDERVKNLEKESRSRKASTALLHDMMREVQKEISKIHTDIGIIKGKLK